MVSTLSLQLLPADVLEQICSKVANLGVKHIKNLEIVSKTFLTICNQSTVLRRVSFEGPPLGPWYRATYGNYCKYLRKCYAAENPVAIYRDGFAKYFQREQEHLGLERFASAASKGVRAAQYLYGVILVCVGGATKSNGFHLLNSYRLPCIETETNRMDNCWLVDFPEIKWAGQNHVLRLKASYVRDSCDCKGQKCTLLEAPINVRQRFARFDDLIDDIDATSCEVCASHFLVQLFFDTTERCRKPW